jgi:two-component system, sensor histidine kinase
MPTLLAPRPMKKRNSGPMAASGAPDADAATLAQISHDLRQPIHALQLHLDALARMPLDAKAAAIVERMEFSLASLARLTRRTDEFGFGGPMKLRSLLAGIVDEARTVAPNRPLRVVAPDATLTGDPRLVETILRNVVQNAVQHGGAGPILVCASAELGAVTVCVWDHGPGLTSSQTHVVTGGVAVDRAQVGLGPRIVREAAAQLGASVSVVARGSRRAVCIAFPKVDRGPTTSAR